MDIIEVLEKLDDMKAYMNMYKFHPETINPILKREILLDFDYLLKKLRPLEEVVSILMWGTGGNPESGLKYDKEAETILIDEDKLMKALQIITPTQKKRNIKVVKNLLEK